MMEWKKNLSNVLNLKMNKIEWEEVGNKMLEGMKNENESLYDGYKIFDGLDNMYPVNWDDCVIEYVEKPYRNYENIVRDFQPLLVLVNFVYKKLEHETEQSMLQGNMPINYFINKSLQNKT